MSHDPNSTRKRPREDDQDEDLHRRGPSRQRFEHIRAHDHARQSIGDQYHGNVNIYQVGASASRSPEPTAIETALESLMFEEMDARYLTIDALLAPSSCKWLLGREEYKRWQDIGSLSEHHGFLWIKGKAGAGKSTLMKFAFNNAEKTRHEDQTVVSFFFNARGAPIERSLIGMYRALLYQILYKIPHLQHLLCKKRTPSAQSQEWSLGVLRSVFQDVIENLASEHLICYVDALDECTEDDVKDMVSFFEDLGEFSVSSGTKFHVCFASRHYPHITIERSEGIVLEDQDGHKADIVSYIKKKLKISNKSLKGEMSKGIEDRASGVFLWVVLVVGILNDECSRGNVQMIRGRLKIIPTGLTDLIKDILDRDKPTKYLVPLLQWVLFSRRPLTPEELFLALQSIEPETLQDSHTPEALARDNIHKFILNTSKGLAEMTKGKKPKVQFIHELVRTHFLGPDGLVKLDSRLQTHLAGQSHDQLKKCCQSYLVSDPCSKMDLPAILPKAESPDGRTLRGDTLDNLPFLQYALENVLYHTNLAHLEGVEQTRFLNFFPFDTWRILNNAIARYTSHRHTASVSQAYILALKGCGALLPYAMESCPPSDEPKERCRSILGAAIDARDIQSVLAILRYKGYENSPGKDNDLCMKLAIEADQLEIVQALVAAKVELYRENDDALKYLRSPRHNALLFACSQPDKFGSDLGPCGLLRLLLSRFTDDDKTDRIFVTALQCAFEESCKFHREDNARLLLREFAHSILGLILLASASAKGQVSVVRMLLEHGAVVEVIDHQATVQHYTAMEAACRNGHLDVVRLLIQHGAKVDVVHAEQGTPLHYACRGGYMEIAQLLLDNDADINLLGAQGVTPLQFAIISGQSGIARMLIERGADIHQASEDGLTALWNAVRHGEEAIARLLIDKGASASICNTSGTTAVAVARRRGNTDIVRLLIEAGATE